MCHHIFCPEILSTKRNLSSRIAGDPAMMMVKHERFGVSVTAARDLPKGYIAAMFGDLVKKEDMKSKNQEYGFQSSSGNTLG